jgi:hypothetical protein
MWARLSHAWVGLDPSVDVVILWLPLSLSFTPRPPSPHSFSLLSLLSLLALHNHFRPWVLSLPPSTSHLASTRVAASDKPSPPLPLRPARFGGHERAGATVSMGTLERVIFTVGKWIRGMGQTMDPLESTIQGGLRVEEQSKHSPSNPFDSAQL